MKSAGRERTSKGRFPTRAYPRSGPVLMVLPLLLIPVRARAQGATVHDCATPAEIQAMKAERPLLSRGEPTAGYHGIRYGFRITAEPGEHPQLGGAPVVDAVPCGSPADRAGIARGDVLLSVNGHDLSKDVQDLRFLAPTEPGMTFNLRIRRDGKVLEIALKSIVRPGSAAADADTTSIRHP